MADKDTGRRGEVRVKARLKVRFKSRDAFISEYSNNISKGGIFIRTKKPCSLRDRVEIVLILPESGDEISVMGEVMHVITEQESVAGTPAGMGIQITGIGDDDRKLIESFVAKTLQEIGRDGLGRREHIRHPSKLRVRFGSKEALVEEYIHNISHGGIFVQTGNPRNLREEIDIILVHPDTNEEFKLSGEVVRIVTQEDARKNPHYKPGMGIRFKDMDESRRKEIDRFIGAENKKNAGAYIEGE